MLVCFPRIYILMKRTSAQDRGLSLQLDWKYTEITKIGNYSESILRIDCSTEQLELTQVEISLILGFCPPIADVIATLQTLL